MLPSFTKLTSFIIHLSVSRGSRIHQQASVKTISLQANTQNGNLDSTNQRNKFKATTQSYTFEKKKNPTYFLQSIKHSSERKWHNDIGYSLYLINLFWSRCNHTHFWNTQNESKTGDGRVPSSEVSSFHYIFAALSNVYTAPWNLQHNKDLKMAEWSVETCSPFISSNKCCAGVKNWLIV